MKQIKAKTKHTIISKISILLFV